MTHTVIDELTQAFPADVLIIDPASMDAYRWDRALDPDAGVPLAVVRPRSTERGNRAARGRIGALGWQLSYRRRARHLA